MSTTGADSPSCDYVFSIGLIDRILSGDYAWSAFFRDTFIQGAHCMVLPILARLAVIRLTDWNIYAELYLTLALFAARLALLYDLLTRRTHRRESLWLWPVLAALLFTLAQIDVFTYGDAGLQIGLVQLGFTLGLWGLVRFPGEIRGVAFASAGGLIATWSGGGGLLTWPVLLLSTIACGFRRPAPFFLLVGTAVVGVLPYAAYLASPPPNGLGTEHGFLLPDLVKMAAAIGQPLVSGVGGDQKPNRATISIGVLGVVLLVLGVLLLGRHRRSPLLFAAVPALLLLTWGSINVAATTMLRKGILSWYSTGFLGFWIGLVGLAYAVWACRKDLSMTAEAGDLERLAPGGWSMGVVGLVTLLYAASNVTYQDHVMFFLPSRSPASAAAIRHYATAPTYSEEIVFVGFSLGHPSYLTDLAYPLDKHGLSQFRPRQRWTLQGEFFLDHVTFQRGAGGEDPYWALNGGDQRGHWRDYHPLDLVVPAGAALTWSVELPVGAKSVELRTTLLRSPAPSSGAAQILLRTPDEEMRELFQAQPAGSNTRGVRLDLAEFAGRKIALCFAASGDGPVVFRHPVIDLVVPDRETVYQPPEVRPSNVDPSDLPNRSGHAFDLNLAGFWKGPLGPLEASEDPQGRLLMPADFIQSAFPLDVPIRDFDRLAVRVTTGVPTAAETLSALRVIFVIRHADGTDSGGMVTLTLLPDGKAHTYTYPLRLLDLQPGDRLRRLRLFSVSEGISLRLLEVRLVPASIP